MTSDLALVLALLGAAVAMFALNRPRMDVVAVMMMVALPLFGIISVNEALAGLGDPNIVLIAALFVIGDGLVRTGVAQRLGDLLVKHAGRSEARLIIFLMIAVAAMGSVMSSTGVVAIFIPIVLRIARDAGLAPGRLMMPLSMAALLSGMLTLVATAPNLVIQSELLRNGHAGFGFFSFTPFGLPLLVLGILYMLVARRWLPGKAQQKRGKHARRRLGEWIEEYALAGREHRLRVRPSSPIIGRKLKAIDPASMPEVNIIAIERHERFRRELIQPHLTTEIRAGDVLFLDFPAATVDVAKLCSDFALEPLPLLGGYFSDRSQEIGMAEMIIPPASSLIDETVTRNRFWDVYDLTVIGLKHGSKVHPGPVAGEVLKAGDMLLVAGPWDAIARRQRDFQDLTAYNLPAEFDDVVPAAPRAPHALAILLLVIVLMVSGIVANVLAALIGCLLMGLFGCITMNSAYRAIHWQSLILIVGMLPFSIALQKTGGVELAANALLEVVGRTGPYGTLAVIFAVTAALGLFISNTATAVLMGPVALAVANDTQASPYPFAMTVALAASAAFMTPVSSPVNTLVVGPGNYTFFDFVRLGVPFTFLVLVVSVLLLPLLLPL